MVIDFEELLKKQNETPGETRLRHIVEALKKGRQPEDADSAWLIEKQEGLAAKLDPHALKRHLELTRRRGRPQDVKSRFENAARVVWQMEDGGCTQTEAIRRVIREHYPDTRDEDRESKIRLIRGHYQEFGDDARQLLKLRRHIDDLGASINDSVSSMRQWSSVVEGLFSGIRDFQERASKLNVEDD